MTAILNTFKNNYIENFPKEVPLKAAQGFIATGALALFLGATAKVALVGGAIAVTSTLIEAVTRPIIKAVFAENPRVGVCIQVLVSKMASISLAAAVAPWVGVVYQTNLFIFPLIAWISLNEGFYTRNVGMVEVL
jgi:hypothetical protein